MNLFIITPPDGSSLFLYFHIVEAVIIFCDYVLLTIWLMMIRRMRLNFHLKSCFLFLGSQFYVYLMARLVIVAYQSGLLYHGKDPEDVFVLIAASWFKGFYLIEILTLSIWSTLERELSLYFIRDYEYRVRYWIPILVTLVAVGIASFGITIYTFVLPYLHLPIYPLICLMFGVSAAGIGIFAYNNHRAARLNTALKAKEPCHLPYSLNIRYQLEENLWLAKIMKVTVAIMTFGNFPTGLAVLGAFFPYFSEETRQIMDCLSNICIAANGPLLAFAVFFRNSYFVGLVKDLFSKKNTIDPIEDEGDFYFEQLTVQWENIAK